jgi:DNA polymerase III gamma/tau subunit
MQDALACLEHLLVGRSADAIAVFHTILAQGVHPKPFLEDCIELLRAAIILSTKADASATRLDLSKEAMARVQALSEQIPQSHLIASTDEAIKRLGEIRKSPIPAFPVELWITACGIAVHGETMPMPTPTTSPVVQTPPPPQKEHTAPKQAPEVKKETAAPETAMAPSPSKPEPTLEEISKPPATAEAPEPLEAPAVQTPEMSPEVPTNVPVSSEPTTTISLGQANAWWKSALQIIEQHSPSLIFVLNMATVVGCDTEQFTIAVGFSFHKDKIESAECAETIVSALAQVSGARRALAVIIDKTAAAAPASSAPDDIHSLAAAFGGQVVGS